MRSIGRKNIRIVIDETKHALAEGNEFHSIEMIVVDRLPSEMWETWEGADSEIRRIIGDTIRGR
jgi:hypothetical protein